jgi:hypothetical protein
METFKAVVRILAALFAAFFGTVQLSMTVCAPPANGAWAQWPCHSHPFVSSALSFMTLLVLTLLALSRRRAQWRMPLAVVLLLTYGLYGVVDAIGYRAWWLALAPVVAAAAAVGVGLRARWGTLMTYAVSALFALYWTWFVAAAALNGTFSSRPPLFGALMLVPGIAFGLLAGFCCYASSGTTPITIKGGSASS